MIATPYQFNLSNTKLVEKIIEDDLLEFFIVKSPSPHMMRAQA